MKNKNKQDNRLGPGWILKDILLCALSALFLILSFPGFNLFPLAWIGFLPLFIALKDKTPLQGFLYSYFTGLLFWAGVIYWLIHVTFLGQVILIAYLALYFGLFGAIVIIFAKLPAVYSVFFLPSAWVVLEYLRSFLLTGFPWALLGYSQYLCVPLIQIADITGAFGVSFLVMAINISAWHSLKERKIGKASKIVIFIFFAVLIYGYFKIYSVKQKPGKQALRVCVIQGNIPQELKWEVSAQGLIMNKYFILSSEAAEKQVDLIIWPEASLPIVLEEEPSYYIKLFNLSRRINAPVLLGAVTKAGRDYYNSALMIAGGNNSITQYNKLHLVPFGEYIPLRGVFPFLEGIAPIGDIQSGAEYTIFQIPRFKSRPRGNFGVLICFEDLFPGLSREFVKRGAGFLVNITNDGWYKKTSAAEQHLTASVFRAVENRIFLARAANTGISGFIDPAGAILSSVKDNQGRKIFVNGYKIESIPKKDGKLTVYTRFGDVFAGLCAVIGLFGLFLRVSKRL